MRRDVVAYVHRLEAENAALRKALAEKPHGLTDEQAGTILVALSARWSDLNRAREDASYTDDEEYIIQLERVEDASDAVAGR